MLVNVFRKPARMEGMSEAPGVPVIQRWRDDNSETRLIRLKF